MWQARPLRSMLSMLSMLAGLAVLLCGCSSMRTADIGHAYSPVTGRQQLMVRGRSVTGDERFLTGTEVRARVGPTAHQIGAGFAMVYQPFRIGTRLVPHVGGGAMYLELGRVDQAFEIGVSEPWLELGMTWMIDNKVGLERCSFQIWEVGPGQRVQKQMKQEGWGLTLTSGAQYDIRFTRQPNEVVWIVTLGASEVVRRGPCE